MPKINHGFSDEIPIAEIVQEYLGVDINDRSLKKVLISIASIYDDRYQIIKPSYFANYKLQYLKVAFEYIIDRVIGLYELDEEDIIICKDFFWNTASAFRIVRKSKPDYWLKKIKD